MTSQISLSACQLISYDTMKTPSSAINLVYDVQKGAVILGVAHAAMGIYDMTMALKNSLREIDQLKAQAIKLDSHVNLIVKIKEISSVRLWNGIIELGFGSGFLFVGLMNLGALNWNDHLMDISQIFCRSVIPTSVRGCSYNCLSTFDPQDGIIPLIPSFLSSTVGGAFVTCDAVLKTSIGVMGTWDCSPEKDIEQEFGVVLKKRRWSPKLILIQGGMSLLTAGALFTYAFSNKLSMTTVYGTPPDPLHFSDSWGVCQTLCARLNMTTSP